MIELGLIRVSMFASATGTKPTDRQLGDVLDEIRTGKHAKRIASLRDLRRKDKEQYDKQKKSLPCFTVSGIAETRKQPGQHSGLLQVDLDNLGDGLASLKQQLKTDSHVAFDFVSPGGDGLKVGLRIDPERHTDSFTAAQAYFRVNYGTEIDPSCKDRLRLCFVSHDPDLWINPLAVVLPIPETQTERPLLNHHLSESCILDTCIPASLHPCILTSQEPSVGAIQANLTARNEALTAHDKRHKGLAAFYLKMVEAQFQAQSHGRNGFIVDAVPFLYRTVAERLVLVHVACFYDCNRSLFHDSRQQHLKEAEAMLKSVTANYQTELSAEERAIYAKLDIDERDTFRICRSLALRPAPDREPFTFFLSFNHLGDRLGIHPMQAQRILRRLEIHGLVIQLEKGTKRAPEIAGKAGTYRWQLATPLKAVATPPRGN